MRLFRVSFEEQRVVSAIRVTPGEAGPGIYLRDGTQVIPVVGGLGYPFGTKSQGEARDLALAQLNESGTKELSLSPPTKDQVRQMKADKLWGQALVHVIPHKVPTKYYSAIFAETVLPGRDGPKHSKVIREYMHLTDASGVETLAATSDGQEYIFELTPGAAFRVHADDREQLEIRWTGRQLTYLREWAPRPRNFGATFAERLQAEQRPRQPAHSETQLRAQA